jgi:hypothetical protein
MGSIQKMASKHEFVRRPGRLVGMGQDVECHVHSVKVSEPPTDDYSYTKLVISDEPPDLPVGAYCLTFDGIALRAEHRHGWILPAAVRGALSRV